MDIVFICVHCRLAYYGLPTACPNCGSTIGSKVDIQFHELPEAEQLYRLRLAAEPGWREGRKVNVSR